MDNTLTPEKFAYIKALIDYRSSLSNGRVKPDKFGNNPYVRESSEYINTINSLDEIIADELHINEQYKRIRNNFNSKNREEFLFKSLPKED